MVNILACAQADIPELARLNRQLIEDEQADNPMMEAQLARRMEEFLGAGYRAFFLEADGNRVGYALVDITKSPLYLRHFFICREHRRQGYGRAAFFALLRHLRVSEMDLDAYVWNRRGIEFWKSLGFTERSLNMRLKL